MKIKRRTALALVLIGLLASTQLFNGCGRKEAVNEGCPSGSFLANATDTITSTGVCGWDGLVYAGSPLTLFGEGCVQDPVFTVMDNAGNPRNNVCLVFTTNGIWWTDHSYTTTVNGDQIVAATDNNGTVTLHWTTYPLPLSSAATSTSAAGEDHTYVPAAISAVSGAISLEVSANITVKGCLAGTNGICP
jgi:hypothetical protein